MKRSLAAMAVLVASLALAAPASAFTPPELYVRLQPWNDSQPVSDWMPLASAPRLNYLAGYQIGYKLQTSAEKAAMTVTGVPDGVPTQPYNDEPTCVFAELRCTLGSAVVPVRGLEDRPLPEGDFPKPGRWSCAARGAADGVDENFERFTFGTPYSAPLAVDVRSDFRRRRGRVDKIRSTRPRLTFTAEWPGPAKGGHVKLTVWRVTGCKGKHYKRRRFGSFRGTFGAKTMRMRMRKPRRNGYYLGRFAFSGTEFIRASVDPAPVYLEVTFHRLAFAGRFPGCS